MSHAKTPIHSLVLARCLVVGSILCAPALGQEILFEIEGQLDFDFLGASVSGAGDVDGDGHDDVVVGAFGYNALGGRVEVYSGRTGALLYSFPVSNFSSTTGASSAGDVDADGHADILVGDTGDATNGVASGKATIYSGRTGGVLFTFFGTGANDKLGSSVSCAGDVNDDGRPDVIVGATESANPGAGPGYARVYSGLDGSLLHEFPGVANGDAFAIVSGAGDVDGDGHADVIVSAGWADTNGLNSGMARVFSGRTGAILHDLVGDPGDLLGFAVSGVGDVDGDGQDDFMVGLPGANAVAGEVRVYSGASGAVLHTLSPGGGAISGAGDLDGDGFPDFLVGPRAFSGRDGSLLFQVQLSDVGETVSSAGDVNNDCFADVIMGAPLFSEGGGEIGKFVVFSGLNDGFESYCLANPNSTGLPAFVCGQGSRTVADNDLRLTARDLPPNMFGYFLASQTQAFVGGPGGSQGNLCLGGQIGRFAKQIQSSGPNGEFTIQVDLTNIPTSPPHSVVAGETWNFQAWFRDKNPGSTSNFTNGVAVTFD